MSAKKLHTINELPHIYELEDMMEFCKKYSKIYIYGTAINQEMLLKYFDMCDVKIMGYVVTWYPEEICFSYREMPVRLVEDVIGEEKTGIIVALSDRYFKDIIPMFREKQFHDYFIMSEFNKRIIIKSDQGNVRKWHLKSIWRIIVTCRVRCAIIIPSFQNLAF